METGDQEWLLEAEEIQKKVHLVSLRIEQEERSIRDKLATKECSIIELEKLVSVQLENLNELQLSIRKMKKCVHSEDAYHTQIEELSQIYVKTFQQLYYSMTKVSSNLNMALEEKDKLTEVYNSQQQEINQLQENKRGLELLHTEHIEQLHQQLNEEKALAAREATALEDARKEKAMLEKRCDEESQQQAARLKVGSQMLLASSEQCSQLVLVHSKLARELTVSNEEIASLAKLKQQTEIQDREQLASRTAELGTWTRVLQERDEELQVAQVEMSQLQQEEATALQHFQVLESEGRVSFSELEGLRAQDTELKVALEGVERDKAVAERNLQVSEVENTAFEQMMEGLGAEIEELQTKKEMLNSQLQQERSRYTLDLESNSSQVGELKNSLQQKQQDLLTVQESLHVQEEECRKAEEKTKVNCQKISQLQTQVLCMQAERLAARKVTADLSADITNLDEKRATLEVNLAEARECLIEQRGKLTEERIQLEKEKAQSILAETDWNIWLKREQDEAIHIAQNREKRREAHKARIESLTRDYEDWGKSQVILEKQALVTLEHELQRKTKEDQVLKARLLHNYKKLSLFHIDKEKSEAKLLLQKKELESQYKKLKLSLSAIPTSSPSVPLNSQGMPQIPLLPLYKGILKSKGQALNTQAKSVMFYESDVSNSSMDIDSQELKRHNGKTIMQHKDSIPSGPKVAVSGRRNVGCDQEYPEPRVGSPRDPPGPNRVIRPPWRL